MSLRRTSAALALLACPALATTATGETPPGRYEVNSAAGTVYDVKTGLTWTRNYPLDGAAAKTLSWSEANAHCAGMGSPWRLPTIRELQSLVDYSKNLYLWDHQAFGFVDEHYPSLWSSSSFKNSAAGPDPYYFVLKIETGHTLTWSRFAKIQVICVRPGR